MKFRVYGVVTGSKYLGIFEAESMEAALEKALDEACVSLCRQCSRQCENPIIEGAEAEEIQGGDDDD